MPKLTSLNVFFVFVCSLSLVPCSLGAREARAQSLSLTISPPILEVMIKPGKSITQVFKLSNEGEPVFVTPRLVEYTNTGIKEQKEFIRDPWINFLPGEFAFDKTFLLRTGETRGFVLRINPAMDLQEENYYRVLLFETSPGLPASSFSQSLVQTRIGSILLLNVTSTGLTSKQARVTRFTIPKLIDSFDPLVATIEVKNIGNTYFRPIGEISLSGQIGKGSFKLQPLVWLAGQTKILTISEEQEPKIQPSTIHLPGFYLGKYTLGVSFTLDEGTVKVNDSRIFYALPWKAAVLLLIFTIGAIIIRKRRRTKIH